MSGALLVLGARTLRTATWPTFDHSNLAPSEEEVQHLEAATTTRKSARVLEERRISFKLGGQTVLGKPQSCAADVALLIEFANADAPVALILQNTRAGQWTIPEVAITPTAFTDDGQIARADVQATLKKSPAGSVRIGIVRSVVRGAAKTSSKPVTGKKSSWS